MIQNTPVIALITSVIFNISDGFVMHHVTNKKSTTCNLFQSKKPIPEINEITSVKELNETFETYEKSTKSKNNDELLKSISVKGDTQIIGSPEHPDFIHPTLTALYNRRKNKNSGGKKIALAIEGGGMRGCVSAGMVAAIHFLGLEECFDVVYGSSAGSLIGAYFITRQLPWFGPEVYYDSLPCAGNRFIDTKRLLRSLGLGLLDPRLLKDVISKPGNGKPVLNLSYLLKLTAQENKPLNWEKFQEMQNVQPLKIVASGLRSEKAIIFDKFKSLEELAQCMHASMLLPGIAGPLMNQNTETGEFTVGNNIKGNSEPLADALVYEPLPYRSAVKDGADHVVVLRTRPDGVDVTGKPSIPERLIMHRFFRRKNKLPNIHNYFRKQYHKKVYAEDVLFLNNKAKANKATSDDNSCDSEADILTIALAPGSQEITRLETGRQAIFEGVRRGFARAFDALVLDPSERGKGMQYATKYFPDEILDYDPDDVCKYIDQLDQTSAFEWYSSNRIDKDSRQPQWGKTVLEMVNETRNTTTV